MALVLAFGQQAVDAVLAVTPDWFTTGLTIAAGILPVTGFAMLLTFMPVNKFYAFLIVGYVLAAYLRLSVLPIALIGVAVAIEYFRFKSDGGMASAVATQNGGELEDE